MMTAIRQRWAVVLCLLLALPLVLHADIYRWDNWQVIPGTEGVQPEPRVQLDYRDLEYALLTGLDLTEANFQASNLRHAKLYATFTGADFTGAQLAYASLHYAALGNARFTAADLSDADLFRAVLTNAKLLDADLSRVDLRDAMLWNANLTGADLTNANLYGTMLSHADLSGAWISGVNLQLSTKRGFTPEQLYSTGSYQQKSLPGIRLRGNDLSNWNLQGQDLTGADLGMCLLTNANLAAAKLDRADLGSTSLTSADLTAAQLDDANLTYSTLTNANLAGAQLKRANLEFATLDQVNLTGAEITGANLREATSRGFVQEQLYSTASYLQRNLQGTRLEVNDFSGWDLHSQDLSDANLFYTTLTQARLAGANLTRANLHLTTLNGADLTGANLTDADLSSSTLTSVRMTNAILTNADLRGCSVAKVDFTGAVIAGANFERAVHLGLTREQLYSTASYQQGNLRGVNLSDNPFFTWDFHGQDLARADLSLSFLSFANLERSNLTGVDFRRALFVSTNLKAANLKNAYLASAISLHEAQFDAQTVYNQGTVFPEGFDPLAAGLTFEASPTGDLDANESLDAADIDFLAETIRVGHGNQNPNWLPKTMFDLNSDSVVDVQDHRAWVKDVRQTWFGDADLNGEFDSADFVQVFAGGRYETGQRAGWADGDWSADGVFDSGDVVTAFADGGYEQGQRMTVATVPEPSALFILLPGLAAWLEISRGRRFWRGRDRSTAHHQRISSGVSRLPALLHRDPDRWLPQTYRRVRGLLAAMLLFTTHSIAVVQGQIYRWDNGQVIPGTEQTVPGPDVRLDHRELEYAVLSQTNLSEANFESSNLANARLTESVLVGANFKLANLTDANLDGATLIRANLEGATFHRATLQGALLTEAILMGATVQGLTREQFYSTANYRTRNLRRMTLTANDFVGWDLAGQDLTSSLLIWSDLSQATLAGANLTNARLDAANLRQTDLSGATIVGTSLSSTGLSERQLQTTASYQARDLRNLMLASNHMSSWDFREQDLSGADFESAILASANFTRANLDRARLVSANLTGAHLTGASLIGASLYDSDLTDTDFTGAVVHRATLGNIAPQQLYSTLSYQSKQLPGIWLDGRDLSGWQLSGQDLTQATFSTSQLTAADLSRANLRDAQLGQADLSQASLSGADLTGAQLDQSTLAGADFTGAWLGRAGLAYTTSRGFAKEQLYTTASYQHGDLRGIDLRGNDLSQWDFTGQDIREVDLSGTIGFSREQLYSTASYRQRNLRGMDFSTNNLTGWSLRGQDLTNARFGSSRLADADFTDAVIAGVDFSSTASNGFTKEQFYATVSYRERNLHGVNLAFNDLSGWDFHGQDLSQVILGATRLTGAILTDAVLGKYMNQMWGFAPEQLYSTVNYQQKNLRGMNLSGNSMASWDLQGQDLTGADLSGTTLRDVNLAQARVSGASFRDTTKLGFTKEQLYATASYHHKDLRGIDLANNELRDWDLSGQNLSGANFEKAMLIYGDLRGADLRNANMRIQGNVLSPFADSSTVYNQWTLFPEYFDPVSANLTFRASPAGDFDANDALDVDDIDRLVARISDFWYLTWRDPILDINRDGQLTLEDHRLWVKELKHTWYGDANLNGEFNSSDFVEVFQAGKYETFQEAGWSEGDWNGDGEFTSADFITAFQDGGYEMGMRPDAAAVPEPNGVVLFFIGLLMALRARRRDFRGNNLLRLVSLFRPGGRTRRLYPQIVILRNERVGEFRDQLQIPLVDLPRCWLGMDGPGQRLDLGSVLEGCLKHSVLLKDLP